MPDPLRSVERLMKEIVPRGIHTCLSSAPSKIDLIPYAFVHVGRCQLSLILRNKISRECSKVRGHIGDTIKVLSSPSSLATSRSNHLPC